MVRLLFYLFTLPPLTIILIITDSHYALGTSTNKKRTLSSSSTSTKRSTTSPSASSPSLKNRSSKPSSLNENEKT